MVFINMMSKADSVEGHGVLSAHDEQVALMKKSDPKQITVLENKWAFSDITHFHTINLGYFFWNLLAKTQGTTVGSVHFLPQTVENSIQLPRFMKLVFYRYLIRFYKNMDYLVTVNPYFVEELMKYGIPEEKIAYIPNVVSKEKFYPLLPDNKMILRQKHGIAEKTFVVLCVGQLQKRKGVLDFIATAKQMPHVQFIWVGDFTFRRISEGYQHIKKAIAEAPSNIRFTGLVPREEMNDYYNMADVMFLPSYEELMPMALLEAMNCQTPILVRNLPEYEKVFHGYCLTGNSNEAFISTLKKLETDPQFYAVAADQSKAGSLFYTEDSIGQNWKNFYQEAALTSKAYQRRMMPLGHPNN